MAELKDTPFLKFNPDTLEAVRKTYNLDTEARMNEALDLLEDWVKKQDHFIKKDFSRGYLERTLITSKGLLERTKMRIDKLCTLKTLMPELFPRNVVRKDYERLNEFIYIAHFPQMTEEHYRVYSFKIISDNFTTEDVNTFYKYTILVIEYLKIHEYPAGFIFILDFRDCNILQFVSKCTPIELRHMVTLMMEGYGLALKQIHIITPSKMVDALVALLKQVLSAKLAQRIHVHKTVDTVYEYVPKELLPIDIGGDERSLKELNAQWLDVVTDPEYLKYFEEMRNARTNESMRRKDMFNEQYIGMPGSFRALSVD